MRLKALFLDFAAEQKALSEVREFGLAKVASVRSRKALMNHNGSTGMRYGHILCFRFQSFAGQDVGFCRGFDPGAAEAIVKRF